MSGKDYQKILEQAERQREAGETPPPSTSPIHMLENNNNNNVRSSYIAIIGPGGDTFCIYKKYLYGHKTYIPACKEFITFVVSYFLQSMLQGSHRSGKNHGKQLFYRKIMEF